MKNIFLTTTLLLTLQVSAQYVIRGTVTDTAGNPLPGATVRILSTDKGTSTNNHGYYQLQQFKLLPFTLQFSFIGYQPKQVTIESLEEDKILDVSLDLSQNQLQELVVSGTRANENTPLAQTNLHISEIERNNLAQDIPVLLQQTVSMVSTSDAGAGVGYTGFRLRGSDATRINVTVNGVPLNDAESHGVWWVNMPDFISSTENIQIQRGVGSSTNGAGAFGGTVNLQTTTNKPEAYGEIASSYGSFNTQKYTARMGTGLLNKHWSIDARASQIYSDGYIDRASSNLRSYFISASYISDKTVVKLIHFAGQEKTYQSWWGTPESRINNDVDAMLLHAENNWLDSAQTANLLNAGRTYNYYEYENEIDHYTQDHYQLHASHQLNEHFSAHIALHYTYGRGYYEQFRKNDRFSRYGLPDLVIGNETIKRTDLIRRRWLDNHFTGTVYHFTYKRKALEVVAGGGYNEYDGDHFGEIIWARHAGNTNIRHRYYDNRALKTDMNNFLKAEVMLTEKILAYADMQVRQVGYHAGGIDNNMLDIRIDTSFLFLNPKGGFSFLPGKNSRLYASLSVGNREPVRSDFIDRPDTAQPKHETLFDYEFGFDWKIKKLTLQTNVFYMDYFNQLILTGELNDVGASIRTNVDRSYRAGVELSATYLLHKKIKLHANATYSQNKIAEFNEVLYDYTNGFDVVNNTYRQTDIAFSPSVIAAAILEYSPINKLHIMLQTKYVGEQFLDNTGNKNRRIAPYQTIDGRITYILYGKRWHEIAFNLMGYNLLNTLYSSNGYTYSYIFDGLITENFYYPQAGTNFMAGIQVKF